MKNKFKLSLLFATAIAAGKMAHDLGKSKIYFIIIMLFAISTLTTLNYYLIAAFLAPLLYYTLGTGSYMKANLKNTFNDFTEIKYLDDVIAWITKKIVGEEPKGILPIVDYQKTFRHTWGFVYATFCGFVFSLPFLLTNYYYGLVLMLWGFACRYLTWHLAVAILFFSYSLLFFISI
jgi:hypothetical protein